MANRFAIPLRGNDGVSISAACGSISLMHFHSGGSTQLMLTADQARQVAATLTAAADALTGAVIVERAPVPVALVGEIAA